MLDTFISLEDSFRTSNSPSDEKVVKVNGLTLDIPKLQADLHHSFLLLSTCNAVTLLKRKQQLKGYLLPKYQFLTGAANMVTEELLGSNVEQIVMDTTKLHEASLKLGHRSRRFRTNYHGRYSQGS